MDALPVWAVVDQMALITPPHDVAAVDDESRPARLNVLHDLARHPFAALKLENLPVHAGQQLHVLDRGLGDPPLVHRQRHHFALAHERHDDLDEVAGHRIEDHLNIALDHLFRHLFRHHQTEQFDKESHEIGMAGLDRQVHHRPRVAAGREGKRALGRRGLSLSRGRQQRAANRRRCRHARKQRAAVDAGRCRVLAHCGSLSTRFHIAIAAPARGTPSDHNMRPASSYGPMTNRRCSVYVPTAIRPSFFASVSRHAHEADPGDLAVGVEPHHQARRVAAREDDFHHVERCVPVSRVCRT